MFFLCMDALGITLSLYVSFLLRFDYDISNAYFEFIPKVLPLFLFVKLSCFTAFRMYRISWRFVSLKDVTTIVQAIFISSLVITMVVYFFQPTMLAGFPRGVLIIDALLTLLLVSAVRISKRVVLEVVPRGNNQSKRTLILGAGNTGEMILRDIQRTGYQEYFPVLMLDDDERVAGASMHGVPIAGPLNRLESLISQERIEAIIIAIPALSHTKLRSIYKQSNTLGVTEIKIVPRIYDVHRPELHVQSLEDIKIEDLIGRQVVNIDYAQIERSIVGHVVLVTGAAGSIGSELVNQICSFHPAAIVLYEIDETELYSLELKLQRTFPELSRNIHFVVGDVRDVDRVRALMTEYRPTVVFHSAAYKHVPMMELNSSEAVKVNLLGTHTVARAAVDAGVERFVMISSDKAVRPTSIMGATKRMAEYICHAFNQEGRTAFVSVRFGNVLGSRGSVLPLFLEQIRREEALTITHPDMSRYFMTIPEAVTLVLQASMIGNGGEVMVLDMGEPLRITELAEDLIRLHDLVPYQDIDIRYIGLRPGEKLFEELLTAEEGTLATAHKKIYTAKISNWYTMGEIDAFLQACQTIIKKNQVDHSAELRLLFAKYIHWYQPLNTPNKL